MSTPTVVSSGFLRTWGLPAHATKNDRGSVLVVGGAVTLPGAVLLAGTAALRAGAGRLQLAVAAPVAPGLALTVPEAMVVGLPVTDGGSVAGAAAEIVSGLTAAVDVVLIGPGLDDEEACTALLRAVLPALPEGTSVVLDAYGLRALAAAPELAGPVGGALVLTPNVAEGAALLGEDDPGTVAADPASAAARIAERYGATVSLQGVVAAADGAAWSVEGGSSGLGTSGSGDVLAGLVTGLLARTGDGPQAACWGTYVHAMSGERLGARVGHLGFLARELLDEAPRVFLELAAR